MLFYDIYSCRNIDFEMLRIMFNTMLNISRYIPGVTSMSMCCDVYYILYFNFNAIFEPTISTWNCCDAIHLMFLNHFFSLCNIHLDLL